jgi:hypothetical protein
MVRKDYRLHPPSRVRGECQARHLLECVGNARWLVESQTGNAAKEPSEPHTATKRARIRNCPLSEALMHSECFDVFRSRRSAQ